MTKLICQGYFCCNHPLSLSRVLRFHPSRRHLRPVQFMISFLMLSFLIIVIILFSGSQLEQRKINRLPDTSAFYKSDNMCALILPPLYDVIYHNQSKALKQFAKKNATSSSFAALTQEFQHLYSNSSSKSSTSRQQLLPPIVSETFPASNISWRQEHNDTMIVAHCGDCGACSNPHDVAIYAATSSTLLDTSTQCAKHGLVGGRRATTTCMVKKVGFTPACNECWVENIMCDLKFCVFNCLWHRTIHRLFQSSSHHHNHRGINVSKTGINHTSQSLNPCTTCDEKRCGPAFIKCAGVNRRRAGIISDIERSNAQVCKLLPVAAWWKSPFLQAYYDATRPPPLPKAHRWPF